ncbi:MAG: MotA/TolQ/ExbB proton channel family protein [Verrucomicrobiaceae bacterium]|nr:MotA/TolQ/ExbB proton channel family protein [Verrucomicrobiaceae bacterium]
MKFKCPSCSTTLQVETEMAGKMVRCPACDSKLQIPEFSAAEAPAPTDGGVPQPTGVSNVWDSEKQHLETGLGADGRPLAPEKPQREGWVETDPTNPNSFVAFGMGLVSALTLLGMLYLFNPPDAKPAAEYKTMEWLAALFFKHALVSVTNTIFFCWAMAILYLKMEKLRHQRRALMLDILPMDIAKEINAENVGQFIDHLYSFHHRLRDSLMVNRIRKGLELFEVRPSNSDVSAMMSSQSDIDSARIGSSFSMVKAFLWAIPILGFIGTVIGLSHAIGGMNLDMDDLTKIKATLGDVVGGLGTAFDATLLGLVLALLLNFPMNAMIKAEDDNLNAIDAFCNEVLLPRLNDGGGSNNSLVAALGTETGAFIAALSQAMAGAQQEFLRDLRQLTAKIDEQAMNLDRRADAHATLVATEFTKTMIKLREDVTSGISDSANKTTDYIRTLATALQGLNGVLKDLGEKQVLIQQVKKKGWFS